MRKAITALVKVFGTLQDDTGKMYRSRSKAVPAARDEG